VNGKNDMVLGGVRTCRAGPRLVSIKTAQFLQGGEVVRDAEKGSEGSE
jgi:hypothetical protein